MFCTHCGKELSDEAIMCPNCGTPTGNNPVRKPERNTATDSKGYVLSAAGFSLSIISLVTTVILTLLGLFFGSMLGSELYVIAGLAGLVFDIFGLHKAKAENNGVGRGLAIAGLVLASVALAFCLIIFSIRIPMYYY